MNTLIGRSPLSPLQLSGALDNVQPRGSRDDFIALAMARNPAIRTQSRRVEIAGLNLRSMCFSRRLDFAIGPSIEYLPSEQTYGVAATLALPLWDQKQGAIETATAEHKKALGELEKTRAEISAEVTSAAANWNRQRTSLPSILRRFSTS